MGKMGSPSRQKRIRLLTYWRNGVATYGKKGCCFLVFCFIDLFFSILGGIKSQDVTKTGVRHMGGKGGRFAGTISSEMPPDREESAAGGGGGVSGRGEVGTDCETADLWWATTPSASSTSPESNCAATESANERGSATPPSLTPPTPPPPPPLPHRPPTRPHLPQRRVPRMYGLLFRSFDLQLPSSDLPRLDLLLSRCELRAPSRAFRTCTWI